MGCSISEKDSVSEGVAKKKKYNTTVSILRAEGCFNMKMMSDKPIYKPGDMAYFHILAFDQITRNFNILSELRRLGMYGYANLILKITDSKGSNIHTQERNISGDGDLLSEILRYKIKEEAAGGIYKASVNMKEVSSEEFPTIERVFRVRKYYKKAINVEVELDKESYFPGDVVYAKVTARKPDASLFTPQALISYTLRIGTVTKSEEGIKINEKGESFFNIVIPEDITENGAMKVQLSEEGEEPVTILQPITLLLETKICVEIIPESGFIVAEVPNTIYFYATDKNGESTEFEGKLFMASHPQIAVIEEVKTLHRGKGKFEFIPKAQEIYYIRIYFRNGGRQDVNIPPCDPNRKIILSMRHCVFSTLEEFKSNPWELNIYSRETKLENVRIELRIKENIIYWKNIEILEGKNRVRMEDLDGLNEKHPRGGICILTLIAPQEDGGENILGERLIYIHPRNTLNIDITYNKGERKYSPGDRVKLDIAVSSAITGTGGKGPPEDIYMNVSVIHSGVFTQLGNKLLPPHLPTMLLLEDEVLKDNQYSQLYFAHQYLQPLFIPPTSTGAHALQECIRNLDLLLGVQGWRRYIFTDPATLETIKFHLNPQLKAHSLCLIGATKPCPVIFREEVKHKNKKGGGWGFNLFGATKGADRGEVMMIRRSSMRQMRDVELSEENEESSEGECLEKNEDVNNLSIMELLPMEEELKEKKDVQFVDKKEIEFVEGQKEEVMSNSSDISDASDIGVERSFPPHKPQFRNQPNFIIKENPRFREIIHLNRVNYKISERIDFYESLYSGFGLKVDKKIKYITAEFDISDTIGEFTILVDAFTSSGYLGSFKSYINSERPFYLNYDIPMNLIENDEVRPQVYIYNKTEEECEVIMKVESTKEVKYEYIENKEVVPSHSLSQLELLVTAFQTGLGKLTARAEGRSVLLNQMFNDSMTKEYKIQSAGFPQSYSKSGVLKSYNFTPKNKEESKGILELELPETLSEGSLHISAKICPTPASTLIEAVESLIREPYGCFEQTSATTYPMVMGLAYLKSHKSSPKVQELILKSCDILKKGYQKLVGYECKKGGYDWFGSDPGHESLTAYGLMQFTEMQQTMSELVDTNMMDRVQKWEWLRKDEEIGGFNLNPDACPAFGYSPKALTSAYIIYALTEIKYKNIEPQIQYLLKICEEEFDGYILGLAGNAFYNYGLEEEGRRCAERIEQDEDGAVRRAKTSITRSGGECLIIETTSLALLAWMRESGRFMTNITLGMNYLLCNCKGGGYFHGTQSTILALKAIIKYDAIRSALQGKANFLFKINHSVIQKFVIDSTDIQNSDSLGLSSFIQNIELGNLNNHSEHWGGKNIKLEISIDSYEPNAQVEEDFEMPFSLDVEYAALNPMSAPYAQMEYKLGLQDTFFKLGHIAKYELYIRNDKQENIGMVVAIVRVPAAFEITYESLEKLKSGNMIAHFEVIAGNDIYLYWTHMLPNQEIKFPLFFIAKFKGSFTARASCAYEYYCPENKKWLIAQKVKVTD